MKLSIIIPQYNETESVITPLLTSIDNQLGIDFKGIEVIILNDGSSTLLSRGFLERFINIKPIYKKLKKNVGVGMCRQKGIECAKGDYIIFCDADDMFYNAGVLGLFLNEIETKNPDICSSAWLEEQKTENGYIYIQHNIEATWIHGKIFRRQYLIDNDIKFLPKFRVHEDTYFVGLAFDLTESKNYIDIVTFVWKHNPISFTRIDNNSFSYKEFSVFMDSVMEMLKVVEKKKPELIPFRVTQFMLYVYFSLQLPYWELEESFEYKVSCEKLLSEFMDLYYEHYNMYPKERFAALYDEEKNKVLAFQDKVLKESFESFMGRILKEEMMEAE